MKRAPLTLALLFLAALSPDAFAQKNLTGPSFKAGDTFFYRVRVKIDRDIRTKSALSLPQTPPQTDLDIQGILQLEVLPSDPGVVPAGIRLRTWFLTLLGNLDTLPLSPKPDATQVQSAPATDSFVDCTLTPAGEIDRITGLDALSPEQQQAWREWANRFAAAFLVATGKRRRGDKWSSDEPETSPSPLADLHWQTKSQYLRDEPCAPLTFSRAGEFQRPASSDSCAVIAIAASLVQKSSPRDSTPPDYKQRNLRTSGTASGANDVVLYISRKTGRLIRATQTATQKMDALIALADGSTKVRYEIAAIASSSVELVADLPLILQPKSAKE